MSLRYQKFVSEHPQEKPNLHHLSIANDDTLPPDLQKQQQSFLKCTVCCGVIAAVILIIAVTMLVLGFTILHVKNPKIKMNSVEITGLDQVNSTELRTGKGNLTLVADVSVKNTNVASFKFDDFNSSVVYRDAVVGVAEVGGGVVKARRTMRVELVYEMMVEKMAGDSLFGSDLTAGNVTVLSYTRINGRVNIMNIVKRKVTVSMNCSIVVNVVSKGVVDQDCKSHLSI